MHRRNAAQAFSKYEEGSNMLIIRAASLPLHRRVLAIHALYILAQFITMGEWVG
jgi:hypothetical protein